jgi:omega-amidase
MKSQKISETMSGNTIKWMKYISSKLNVVLCGSLFVKENDKFLNRFVWVQANGTMETYDKRHLFSLGDENKHYQRGDKATIIDYKGWKIFPQICYDLRFPVWSRNTFAYDLLINVANWPAPRFEVWNTLLNARAIENQCYVAAVNRLGEDANSILYRGDSVVIDAKGKVISNASDKFGIHYSTLSKSGLISFRNKFNTLSDADRFSIDP